MLKCTWRRKRRRRRRRRRALFCVLLRSKHP
jgi:hypothetical protein